MSVQRLAIAFNGFSMQADDRGSYIYYQTHKAVVELLQQQLDLTQAQLDEEREFNRKLVDKLR